MAARGHRDTDQGGHHEHRVAEPGEPASRRVQRCVLSDVVQDLHSRVLVALAQDAALPDALGRQALLDDVIESRYRSAGDDLLEQRRQGEQGPS